MKTYEAILAANDMPYTRVNGPEYVTRLREGRPTNPPRWTPGCFVYSSIWDANVPVVAVGWDNGYPRQAWRIHTPGHGGFEDNFTNPLPTKKTKFFADPTGTRSWAYIGEMPPLRNA